MDLNKKVKKLDLYDIVFTKLSVAAGILFLLTVLPVVMDLVVSIHWEWFLVAFVVFAIRPIKRFYF